MIRLVLKLGISVPKTMGRVGRAAERRVSELEWWDLKWEGDGWLDEMGGWEVKGGVQGT